MSSSSGKGKNEVSEHSGCFGVLLSLQFRDEALNGSKHGARDVDELTTESVDYLAVGHLEFLAIADLQFYRNQGVVG